MAYTEKKYHDILQRLMHDGNYREGRNGGVYSLFGEQMRFDLSEGFPLLTTKKVHFKSIKVELLWFLSGNTNTKYLRDHGVTIWDEWVDSEDNLGPVYGAQWRGFGAYNQYGTSARIPGDGVDQIKQVINSLKTDPYSRRHIVSAWNPLELKDMALPPCHMMFQFYVAEGKLSCHLYQRSADWFLGVPFNIASYALLTHLVARETNLEVGEFIHTFGDLHLYSNHVEAALQQLENWERGSFKFPTLEIQGDRDIFSIVPDDIKLLNYISHNPIKAEVSA